MAAPFQRLLFLALCLLGKCDFPAAEIALPVFGDAGLFRGLSATDSAFRHLRSPPLSHSFGDLIPILAARRIRFRSPRYIRAIFRLKNPEKLRKSPRESRMTLLHPFRFKRESKLSALLDDLPGFLEAFHCAGNAYPMGAGEKAQILVSERKLDGKALGTLDTVFTGDIHEHSVEPIFEVG